MVSSPDFDDDYLRVEVDPYVKLYQMGSRLEGEYHLGLQSGDLGGLPEGDDRAVFRFEGMDEIYLMNGVGMATLDDDCPRDGLARI